jgi:phenylalanine-4-hydroxylase
VVKIVLCTSPTLGDFYFIIMRQYYDRYTTEDHEIWNILFTRQVENLQDKACHSYLECVNDLHPELESEKVADFTALNAKLKLKTGWQIEVVKGLIPVEDFFQLLSTKRFCSSTWLRSRSQLDYLEEPDMFHDTFGHVPLLIDQTYSAFMHKFGMLGARHIHDERALTALQRLYWFSIEFGLMKGAKHPLIYGAGILSSFGESNHAVADGHECLNYDLVKVINNPFITTEIQTRYYLIESFQELYNSLDQLEELIAKGLDIIPAIVR